MKALIVAICALAFCYAEYEQPQKSNEEKKSPHTFTANVSLVSDYRFRGISETMRRPAIQGGFDYAHKNGIYLGTWASNVDGTTHIYNNTSMEWDFYGGYKGEFHCLHYNFGIIYYYYPGGKADNCHNTRYNTADLYLELTFKWFTLKYYQTITDYIGVNSDDPPFNWDKDRHVRPNGSSRGTIYMDASVNFDLFEKLHFRCFEVGKLNLLLLVGHLNVRNYSQLNYTNWRATLTQEFAWVDVFLSYEGTNARHAFYSIPDSAFHPRRHALGAQGVVVGVTKTF